MTIGRTYPPLKDFGLLYPKAPRLQNALCEYLIVIINLSKHTILFLKKPLLSQFASSLTNTFESEFEKYKKDLEKLANTIQIEVSVASKQIQASEAIDNSVFRSIATQGLQKTTQELREARNWRKQQKEKQFLLACSSYDYQKSWKQARKKGNANWIFQGDTYEGWKEELASSTIWCCGILGSGKTVLSANVIEDIMLIRPEVIVAYFFCPYDETASLLARTIIGSIVRQILQSAKLDMTGKINSYCEEELDTDQLLRFL